jgi:hypothetical protein
MDANGCSSIAYALITVDAGSASTLPNPGGSLCGQLFGATAATMLVLMLVRMIGVDRTRHRRR